MKYEDLKFTKTPNGNDLATVTINKQLIDIIIIRTEKKPTCKVKPFELQHGRKQYIPDFFEGHGQYAVFNGKTQLITFLTELENTEDEEI